MATKEPGTTPDRVRVTFNIPPSVWADEVHLVGDFNDWDPRSLPLERSNHDGWRVTLELPRGRTFHYRFLLDGTRWCNDWGADRFAPNPYGGDNSVLET
jgi:1,4-alpha-glucan branching enzyme